MEVAAAAPAFDALAFAFAAFAFALVAGALLIGPLQVLSGMASTVPVVGGALSWLFSSLADLVQSAVDGVNNAKQAAYGQATGWWNWLVTNTLANYYGDINGKFGDLYARSNSLWNQVYGVIAAQVNDLYSQVAGLWNLSYGVRDELNSVIYSDLPLMRSQINALSSRASTLENDVYTLRTIVLGALGARVDTLERDVIDFERWRDYIGNQVLPRLQQDIGLRAFESEVEALRSQLGAAQNQLSILWPLALLAAAGATAIDNLRCHMDVPCDPLSQLAQSDVVDRLNHLEISEG